MAPLSSQPGTRRRAPGVAILSFTEGPQLPRSKQDSAHISRGERQSVPAIPPGAWARPAWLGPGQLRLLAGDAWAVTSPGIRESINDALKVARAPNSCAAGHGNICADRGIPLCGHPASPGPPQISLLHGGGSRVDTAKKFIVTFK